MSVQVRSRTQLIGSHSNCPTCVARPHSQVGMRGTLRLGIRDALLIPNCGFVVSPNAASHVASACSSVSVFKEHPNCGFIVNLIRASATAIFLHLSHVSAEITEQHLSSS